jgi:D-sedoheptulose 7-phosphate isomerase
MTGVEVSRQSASSLGPGWAATLRDKLRSVATHRFDRSIEAPRAFFDANADAIARATLAMAHRFRSGGRLLVFGEGASSTDAQHVSVEFVHPVIVGKRALPAIALTNDTATVTSRDNPFSAMIATLGRPGDIALGLADEPGENVTRALDLAHATKMLTMEVRSQPFSRSLLASRDHIFRIDDDDPLVVQEVSETLYHILWEQVHVFLDHMPGHAGGGRAHAG